MHHALLHNKKLMVRLFEFLPCAVCLLIPAQRIDLTCAPLIPFQVSSINNMMKETDLVDCCFILVDSW